MCLCSTFTEEAERHCKHAGEVLEEGLTVSGQGLVYNFDNAQYGSYKVRCRSHPACLGAPAVATPSGRQWMPALQGSAVKQTGRHLLKKPALHPGLSSGCLQAAHWVSQHAHSAQTNTA